MTTGCSQPIRYSECHEIVIQRPPGARPYNQLEGFKCQPEERGGKANNLAPGQNKALELAGKGGSLPELAKTINTAPHLEKQAAFPSAPGYLGI